MVFKIKYLPDLIQEADKKHLDSLQELLMSYN